MAEYQSSLDRGGSFEFDAEALDAFVKRAQKFVGVDPTITIELKGGHEISGTELSFLLEDPYVRSTYIKEVSIKAHANTSKVWRQVDLALGGFMTPVSLRLSGDRDATLVARTDLERLIDGQQTWYSRFLFRHSLPNYYLLPALGLLMSLLVATAAFMAFSIPISLGRNQIDGRYALLQLVGWGVFGLMMFKMFPFVCFDIGRSASKSKSARHWRTIVGSVILLGTLVGIGGNLLTNRITK